MPEGDEAAALQWVDIHGLGCPKEGRFSRFMLGLPERGQTFGVLKMGSACISVLRSGLALKARMQHAFSGLTLAGLSGQGVGCPKDAGSVD